MVQEGTVAKQDLVAELADVRAQQERLPALISQAQQRGDFEETRRLRSQVAELGDHVAFLEMQVSRAHQDVLAAELYDAEHAVVEATAKLEAAFVSETNARMAHDASVHALRSAQARLSTAQARVASLQQRQSTLTGREG